VLEVGCGIGAQTVTLAKRGPDAQFMSVDVSDESIAKARQVAHSAGLTNVAFRHADVFALPFDAQSFDHVFVCFVLEHLSQPVEALAILRGQLKPGGTITVIEGDHGSAYFYPNSSAAHAAIECLVQLQREAGGNALIGRRTHRARCWFRSWPSFDCGLARLGGAPCGAVRRTSCRRESGLGALPPREPDSVSHRAGA
jgi:SAM-dependent methyltransferase